MKGKDHIALGTVLGLLVPALTLLIVYFVGFSGFKFIDFFRYTIAKHILENLVSLCGLANLPLFYLFIQTSRYESVKGIILATFILVVLVIYLKFGV
jgi:hypothetical protein